MKLINKVQVYTPLLIKKQNTRISFTFQCAGHILTMTRNYKKTSIVIPNLLDFNPIYLLGGCYMEDTTYYRVLRSAKYGVFKSFLLSYLDDKDEIFKAMERAPNFIKEENIEDCDD